MVAEGKKTVNYKNQKVLLKGLTDGIKTEVARRNKVILKTCT